MAKTRVLVLVLTLASTIAVWAQDPVSGGPDTVLVQSGALGGSLTLLLAERDNALATAVDFVPVLFIHAANDYSAAPGDALAAEMARLGKPHRIKIYPPFGTTAFEGHNLVHLSVGTWEPDVFTFLDEILRR